MVFNKPVPITDEVSVHPMLISALSARAFPNVFDFMVIVDKLTDEAFEEVYSSKNTYKENEEQIEIRYFQKLWNLILEKGRNNNV